MNKPGRGVSAAVLIFYGYVSFLVSIISHVTSWQNRIILHSTFHCFLIHGCVCFLALSPGMWRVLLCSLVFVYCAIILVLFSALQVTMYKVYLLVNPLQSFDNFWSLYALVCEMLLWCVFFSIVWKQSGGRSILRKGCAHLHLSRVHQVIEKRSDIVRFEAFGKSQNFCKKTCKIFENP